MPFIAVLTVDRNAKLPSSHYPGPLVEVEETIFPDVFLAMTFVRTMRYCLGVLEAHVEDAEGATITEADIADLGAL